MQVKQKKRKNMIYAQPRLWAKGIFFPLVYLLLRFRFDRFYLCSPFPEMKGHKSLLITPNHFSWWDGFFIHLINRKKIKKPFYIMMLQSQLKRYWYFRHVGAFSIDPGNRKGVMESLNYCRSLLKKKDASVILFPQGEIEPYEKTDLSFFSGALRFLVKQRDSSFKMLPICFKIHYSNRKKPDIYCLAAPLIDSTKSKDSIEEYGKKLQNLRNDLDQRVLNHSINTFERIF